MKGPRIDDRISFLRGIERDWKNWSAGKNTKPHWIFLVGVLVATGMLIFSFCSGNQRFTVASIAIGIAFLLAGLLQAGEAWEEKIQRKIRAYEPLDIDAMRTLAVSVFHKDELTREELRQWLDAEFSAISDAALRGGSRNA
ncbi:MgtC/SapB family protein [Enterobacter sp. BNK-16]|uniref:MgtC/SapB family protein n=1 Tax=Enterobacter sp. BNK-16 TaxID=3376153 RepID=UPI003B50B437